MIYAALEHRIRQGLVEQNHQCGGYEKETDPAMTARLDLCVGGIREYRLGEAPPQVTLTGDQQIILEVLGERYRQIFIPKSGAECRLAV